MSNLLEVRKTETGKLQARRKDGLPLTPEDKQQAKILAEQLSIPPRAQVTDVVRSEAGNLRAAKIHSGVLDDDLWLIIDRDFQPHDELAIYYAEELAALRTKTPEDLREIHRVKIVFPGSRVIQ